MRPLSLAGIALICVGAFLLIRGGSFTTRRDVLKVGDVKLTADEKQTIPPWVGGDGHHRWCRGRRGRHASTRLIDILHVHARPGRGAPECVTHPSHRSRRPSPPMATVVGGCATNARTGAVVGAGGGAVIGGVIGKVAGSTAKGAIIGAVVGGTAGAMIGARMDRQAQELEQNIPGATVERVGEGIQVTFASGLLYDFDSDVVKTDARTEPARARRQPRQVPRHRPGHHWSHRPGRDPAATTRDCRSGAAMAAADYLTTQGVAGVADRHARPRRVEPIATQRHRGRVARPIAASRSPSSRTRRARANAGGQQ